MSDRPPNNDMHSGDAPPNAGWETPESRSSWQEPEKPKTVGWRVPTLPKELEDAPDDTGNWHLPDPNDTIFSPDDETEIYTPEDARLDQEGAVATTVDDDEDAPSDDASKISAPEDLLFESASSVTIDDNGASEEQDRPLAPEDLIYLIEHDESSDNFQSGEMLAALSLTDEVALDDVIQDLDSDPITSALESMAIDDETTGETEELSDAELSPAELAAQRVAALMQEQDAQADDQSVGTSDPVDEELDPAEVARRQIAALQGGDAVPNIDFDTELDDEVSTDDTASLDATGELDPAEVARRQIEALQGGTGSAPDVSSPPLPPPPPANPLNAREMELARRFHEVENQVDSLRRMRDNGTISNDDYLNQLRQLMILDDDQIWWMMGVESDKWYRSEGDSWVEGIPSVLAKERDYNQATGQSNPFGGLDYLTDPQPPADSGVTSVASGEYSPPQEYTPPERQQPPQQKSDSLYRGLGTGDDLNPQQVPVNDPYATVAGPAAFADTIDPRYTDTYDPNNNDLAQETQVYEPPQTVRSGAFDGTIPSAATNLDRSQPRTDPTAPPDISRADEAGEEFVARREEERQSSMRIAIFGLVAIAVIALLIGAGVIAMALLWYNGISDEYTTDIAALENYEPEFQTVTILDANGSEIGSLGRDGDDRRVVPIEQISPEMIYAILAMEDPSFYQNPGWDFFSIVRAFLQNLGSGEITSGASTITQQVARNLVLDTSEVSADRKVNEVIVAAELSQAYSKSDILELYLNEINFGNQTYGVEAAARFYFDIGAEDLNLAQAAFLAGIVPAPAENDPVSDRNLALQNMRAVLQRMADAPCIQFQHAPYTAQPYCVTQADIDPNGEQMAVMIALVEGADYEPRAFGVQYPHFVQIVQAQLENYFGTNEIYSNGYTVTTTLNASIQDAAQVALENQVQRLSPNGVNTGSVMVTNPQTCEILALIGSPDFNNDEIAGQVNNALTFQQPASTIKPIVYTAAMRGVDRNGNGALEQDEYYTPATITWDVPTVYADGYTPTNFDNAYRGPTSVRAALQNSYNVPAIKTYDFIGTDAFINTAQAMGLRFQPEADFNLTTGIGTTEVRLYDLMIAYGAFANGGIRCQFVPNAGSTVSLTTIRSIVDVNGNDVPLPVNLDNQRVLNESLAFLMNSILSDDLARSPQFGQSSALTIPSLPNNGSGYVGAKSGTSDSNRDLWTVGYTSNIAVGVWMGRHDDGQILNLQGSTAAAPVWNEVMRNAIQGTSPRAFTPPTNAVSGQVCADTGTLPYANCPSLRNEFYLAAQPPPPGEQGVATTVAIDSWSGLLANNNCPDNQIVGTFVNVTDGAAIEWMNNTAAGNNYAARIGLSVPVAAAPLVACDLSTTIPVARISSPNGGQTIQGVTQVTGQVSADGFNRYQLEYANVNTPTQFFLIDGPYQQQQPAAGSVLGTWDSTQVPNGQYIVRLAVFSNSGGFLYRTAQPVTVNNPTPTATPEPLPTQSVPNTGFTPIPFDTLPAQGSGQTGDIEVQPVQPTVTVDPLG